VTVHTPEHASVNLIVPPNGSIDYDVVAPKISVAYEQVTYEFLLTGPFNFSIVDFPVIVVNYGIIQIFNFSVQLLMIFAAISVALVAIVISRRRRSNKKN
jgi:hypothetical protein